MDIASSLLVALGWVLASPQDEPPPKPVVEAPGEPRVEPKPEYPPAGGLTLRTIFLRPRFELTTREFDIGKFSGHLDYGDVSDFDRTAVALDARYDRSE